MVNWQPSKQDSHWPDLMCQFTWDRSVRQLIDVTWFIWKLSADQLIVLIDRDQCSISFFLASLEAQENWYCTHIGHQYCDQLTAVKTGYPLTSITWPYRGLRCRPIEVKYLSADKLLVFKWSQAQLKFWFQTDLGRENSASCHRQGRQLPLTFLTMVTLWSRSTFNFYALIGQNLTGEFMWKIYAAFWILCTLTADADRVLCQLVMFLTVFFYWMYKMKFSCYQESSVTHG